MTTAGEQTGRRKRREFSPLAAFALSAALLALGYYRGSGEQAASRRAVRESGAARGEGERSSVVSAPPEIVARGETGVLRRVYYSASAHRAPAIAAGVAFYSLLAILPAIAAMAAFYALYADPAMIRSHLQSLSALFPAGAIAFVGDQIMRIAGQDETTRGAIAAVASLVSLWSANAGMKAVFDALDVVHEVREKRGFFALNAISLIFTVLGAALIVAAVAVIVAWPMAIETMNFAPRTERLASALRWPLLVLLVSMAISIVYRFGPSRTTMHWQWLSVGSLFAAVAWLAASVLFSWGAESLRRFDATYGALGAVICFMLWLWLSNVGLLVGAEFDAQTEEIVGPED